MNIPASFSDITEYFSPKIVAEVNNEYVKLAKIKGQEVPWHAHENEDELFYIVSGNLLMELEGKDPFIMETGDLFVVKKGTIHRVSSTEECQIMLIETKTTQHTGDVVSTITKSIEQQSY